MPPRIPLFQCLKTPHVGPSVASPRAFTTSSAVQATARERRSHDPYAIAQAKARKAANLSRQEVLKQTRAASLGDPVRGITTPYVQSFDTAVPLKPSPEQSSLSSDSNASEQYLNFFLNKSELDEGLSRSRWLTAPSDEPAVEPANDTANTPAGQPATLASNYISETTFEEREAQAKKESDMADEAITRIAALEIGSHNDRLRVNIRRCINDFGRHNTDKTLAPRAPAKHSSSATPLVKTPRVGPDSGSSEVQIAILTAKIRSLAGFLETRGTMDKVNKRNLRLLVHRRQKLLRYLRRKERGGPRWQNLIETLGLTEGTWQGEISL